MEKSGSSKSSKSSRSSTEGNIKTDYIDAFGRWAVGDFHTLSAGESDVSRAMIKAANPKTLEYAITKHTYKTNLIMAMKPESFRDGSSWLYYRSKLSGLLAILYTICCLCLYYNITTYRVKYYCDNKRGLSNAFSPMVPGIIPYLQTDADLVFIATYLIKPIPVTITVE